MLAACVTILWQYCGRNKILATLAQLQTVTETHMCVSMNMFFTAAIFNHFTHRHTSVMSKFETVHYSFLKASFVILHIFYSSVKRTSHACTRFCLMLFSGIEVNVHMAQNITLLHEVLQVM